MLGFSGHFKMAKDEIIEQLKSLKEKRLFGSEVEKLIEPFKGKVHSFDMTFDKSERSFGSQPDPAYDNGHKMTCAIPEGPEITVLIPADQEEFINGLKSGDNFNFPLQLLGYDGLYHRAVFGKVSHKEETPNEEPLTEAIEETTPSHTEEKTTESPPKDEEEISGDEEEKKRSLSFPKSSDKTKKSSRTDKDRGYYVVLKSVNEGTGERKSQPAKPESNGVDQKTVITSYLSALIPQFKFTFKNFKMWSIRNIAGLYSGRRNDWEQAKRLIKNCPALIKWECTKKEARSLKKELENAGASVDIHPYKEWHDLYERHDKERPDYKQITYRQIVLREEIKPIALNLQRMNEAPKSHLYNVKFTYIIALSLYALGVFLIMGPLIWGILFVGAGYGVHKLAKTVW